MALTTEVYYLERLTLYETQKPYMLTFDLPAGVGKHTIHSYAPCTMKVCDAQPRRTEFSLDTHGVQFEEWETSFTSEGFDIDDVSNVAILLRGQGPWRRSVSQCLEGPCFGPPGEEGLSCTLHVCAVRVG